MNTYTTYTFENPVINGRLTNYAKILLTIWLNGGMLTKKEILRKMFPNRDMGNSYYSSVFGEMSKNGLIIYYKKDWSVNLTPDGLNYVFDYIVGPHKNLLIN